MNDELDKILRDAYEAAEPDTRPVQSVVLRALAFYGLGLIVDVQEATDPDEIEDIRREIVETTRAMAQLIKEGD